MKWGCFCSCCFDTSLIKPHKLHSRVWQVKIYTAWKVKIVPACPCIAQICVDCCWWRESVGKGDWHTHFELTVRLGNSCPTLYWRIDKEQRSRAEGAGWGVISEAGRAPILRVHPKINVITDGTQCAVWYVYLFQLYPNGRNLKLFSVTLEWGSESVLLLYRLSSVLLHTCSCVCVCVWMLVVLVQMRSNQAEFVYLGKAWEIQIGPDFNSHNTVCLIHRKTEGAPEGWE